MSWYYIKDSQPQQGPITKEALLTLYRNQEIKGSDLVWTKGMASWEKAESSLIETPPQTSQYFKSTPQLESNIYAPPSTERLARADESSLNGVVIKRASFALLIISIVGGFILMMAGTVILSFVEEEVLSQSFLALGAITLGLGFIPLILGGILNLMYIYRSWLIVDTVSNGTARTTPGKAVGFLFIPFFNLYWFFVAFHSWSQEYNRLLGSPKHRVPEGVFLTLCILNIVGAIPLINYLSSLALMVIWPITMFNMCKTINIHANA